MNSFLVLNRKVLLGKKHSAFQKNYSGQKVDNSLEEDKIEGKTIYRIILL